MNKILFYSILLAQIVLLQSPNGDYITASQKSDPNKKISKKELSKKQNFEEKSEKSSSKKQSSVTAVASGGSTYTKHYDRNKQDQQQINKNKKTKEEPQEDLEELRKKNLLDSLFKAIKEQDIQEIQKNLAAGVDINDPRILQEAVKAQNPEIVQILFNAGMSIGSGELLVNKGILHLAAMYGNAEIITMLINHGADVHEVLVFRNKELPLLFALKFKNPQAVKVLLDNGANVDWLSSWNEGKSEDVYSNNSLKYAVADSDLACLKELLDHDADMTINENGLLGFHLAVRLGEESMVKEFLDHHVDIEMKDDDDKTALHYAVGNGQYNIAKLLLNNGADKNAVDNHGVTPILLAAGKDLAMLQLLLDHKANIQAVDKNYNTVLHYATKSGRSKVVQKLIEEHPEMLNVKNKEEKTPLHFAAENNDIDMVTTLLKSGADATLQDKFDKKPLDYVLEEYPELIDLLKKTEKKQSENFQSKQEEEKEEKFDKKNDDDEDEGSSKIVYEKYL